MSKPQRNVHFLVKLFVAFHLFAILVWAMPYAPEPIRNGSVPAYGNEHILLFNERKLKSFPPIRTYLQATGAWQYWDMFSPNPADTDLWGFADIVREDGSIQRYRYPRMYELDLWQKFLLERYRKFFERAHHPDYRYLWQRFAIVVASKVDDDPANRPTEVRLYRNEQVLSGPGKPLPKDYISENYFTYRLKPIELDEVRRP